MVAIFGINRSFHFIFYKVFTLYKKEGELRHWWQFEKRFRQVFILTSLSFSSYMYPKKAYSQVFPDMKYITISFKYVVQKLWQASAYEKQGHATIARLATKLRRYRHVKSNHPFQNIIFFCFTMRCTNYKLQLKQTSKEFQKEFHREKIRAKANRVSFDLANVSQMNINFELLKVSKMTSF